jgi:endonuclease-8
VQFDGPVLELMTDGRTRFDQRLAALGPDLIQDGFDEAGYLRRLREYDPTRGIGEALLDQRVVAGIGNVWKNEGCFIAGVSPWRRVRDVTDREALEIVRGIRPLMQASAERGGRITTFEGDVRRNESRTWVHDRRGMPCRRCGARIRSRGQGDDNRTTFWCPECER